MKTSTLLVATLLGFAIATMQGQTQSSTTTSYVQTSKIVGMKVKDSSGQEVGVVKDVVLDRNTGCMAYTVLSTGGTGTHGAQTGVAGQATTAGSPGAAASPAATAMASPTATVATSPAASPRATASPTATAKATATSTASRRATATPSSEAESTGERR